MVADTRQQPTLRDRLSDDALASAPWRVSAIEGTIHEPRWFSFTVPARAVRLDVGIAQQLNASRLLPTVEKLIGLLSLSEDWDSYGAPPIDPQAVEAAINILSRVLMTAAPMPDAVPTNRGMVQLEWHQRGIDLEIEVLAPGECQAFFRDREHGQEVEMEIDVSSPVLHDFLAELSRHTAQ